MRTYGLKVGETKQFGFDFAPLENDIGSSNFLDRVNSPVEQLTGHTLTVNSPTGITINSSRLEKSNTRVTYSVTGVSVGRWEVICQATTSNSPAQEPIAKMVFKVINA